MITFDHVTKRYRTNIGLDDVSVHIKKGDFVFLVGPSGAGKSTFIKLVLKEIDADKGSILVDKQEVTRLSNREIPQYRRKLGTVFQDFRLLPKKTVFENVAFAMEVLHKTQRQIRKQVPQVLSLVGISDKAHKYPEELSAGEQQRVAIARAIVNNPTVLIADEPTGNLDPDTAWEIMDLLEQINLRGTTIVMVTHAKDIVDRMKKRVIAIEAGRIVRDEQGVYGYEQEGKAGESIVQERVPAPERKSASARISERAAERRAAERTSERASGRRRRAKGESRTEPPASSAENGDAEPKNLTHTARFSLAPKDKVSPSPKDSASRTIKESTSPAQPANVQSTQPASVSPTAKDIAPQAKKDVIQADQSANDSPAPKDNVPLTEKDNDAQTMQTIEDIAPQAAKAPKASVSPAAEDNVSPTIKDVSPAQPASDSQTAPDSVSAAGQTDAPHEQKSEGKEADTNAEKSDI